MLRLLMLLCAGGYIYSLGHNSAGAASDTAAKPSTIAAVASAGAGWIAREVHEQTAWAAAKPAQPQIAEAQPVAAAFAEPPAPAPSANRGLRIVFEPEITVASR